MKIREPCILASLKLRDRTKMRKTKKDRVVRVRPNGVLESLEAVPPEPAKSATALALGTASRANRQKMQMEVDCIRGLCIFFSVFIMPFLQPTAYELHDYDRWIDAMDWPQRKKEALKQLAREQLAWLPYTVTRGLASHRELEVYLSIIYGIFQKKEFYDVFDVTRVIFGMTDWIRIQFGDILKRINAQFLHSPYTLHGVPVDEWAQATWDRMTPEQKRNMATDASGFEGIFIAAVKCVLIYGPTLAMAPFPADRERVWTNIMNEMKESDVSCKDFSADRKSVV